jgi:HlyD family secretion protein
MTNKRPPIPIIVLVLLIILAVAGYFIWQNQNRQDATLLTASGTIEATEISISPELSGKISEVKVGEGDNVKIGEVVIQMDETILKAQRLVAASALETAKAAATTAEAGLAAAQSQYAIVLQTSLNEDQATRKRDWAESKPGEFEQPNWFFSPAEQIAVVDKQVEAAEADLKKKSERLQFLEEKVSSAVFLNAEQDLLDARLAFKIANEVLKSVNNITNDAELRDAAQNAYDDAKDKLDDAQEAYSDLLTTDEADEILTARAELSVARETYATAMDHARKFDTGERSLKLAAAQTAVDQAKAGLNQAQTAVKQAEANLALIDTQIKQLTILSPAEGVVLTRLVEPGEFVTPGSPVMTVADIADLTITVYVPEYRIGEVSLDQTALLTVDSFPGASFKATVVYISDQAEYTPRNVQTVDGRRNTVFAVKLKLEDTTGKLKPGMPADVVFNP